MLKTVRSTVNVDQITGVLPVVNGGTGVTTSTGTGSVVLSAAPTLSGNVSLSTGNIVPSTAGNGVNFTANTPAAGMTSQLLNWYEEGTWVPTDGSGAGLSLTVNSASYVKVGSLVTLSAYITYPVNVNGNGAAIGGKPFDTIAANYFLGTGRSSAYANDPVTIQTNPGVANILTLYVGNTSFANAVLSGATFFFSITYRAI